MRRGLLAAVVAGLAVVGVARATALEVQWVPAAPRPGDVGWVQVVGALPGAVVEGTLAGSSLAFFPHGAGQAAVVGYDLEMTPGHHRWQVEVRVPGRESRHLEGRVRLQARAFPVQRLTLPRPLVDLDPDTERRAIEEGDRLRTLVRMITPERLWRGPFLRPVAGTDPGTGFGARRVINGRPRSPHTGADYAAPRGTPVLAANRGRVALVAEFFFPGRLVVLDHGLGLHTLYFHLDEIRVVEGEPVDRGQPVGTVGATGRATGPHLHFGVQVGAARVDPATLLGLAVSD